LIFFDRKQPKSPVFTPVFRLSVRTGKGDFFSRWWCSQGETTTYCAFVPLATSSHFGTFFDLSNETTLVLEKWHPALGT
jgi:hypothetical protein